MALTREEVERLGLGLLDAARSGDLSLMKDFAERLDRGQGLLETYFKYRGPGGQTALILGANGGCTNICKYCIEVVGLDVNSQDFDGGTALIKACLSRNHHTVAYLIRKGANVNLADHQGYTALHTAARRGLKETMQLLISNGADVEALCRAGYKVSPLFNAASTGQKEAVKILLDNNANPNSTSPSACSPLMASVAVGSHECTKLLLKAGADPNLGLSGVTPLQAAVKNKQTEAIKCLLKGGANPNVTNFEGMTPLEISAFCHYHEGVKVLFPKTNPIPSIRDWTPRGIISAVHSREAKYQREQKKKVNFMESKTKGAEAFKKEDYFDAIYWYNTANFCDPLEATILSNRSLCWARLDEGHRALADAEACIALKPNWPKAHFRKGVACEILKDFCGAAEAYAFALKLEPGNNGFKQLSGNLKPLGVLSKVIEEEELGFCVVNSGVFRVPAVQSWRWFYFKCAYVISSL